MPIDERWEALPDLDVPPGRHYAKEALKMREGQLREALSTLSATQNELEEAKRSVGNERLLSRLMGMEDGARAFDAEIGMQEFEEQADRIVIGEAANGDRSWHELARHQTAKLLYLESELSTTQRERDELKKKIEWIDTTQMQFLGIAVTDASHDGINVKAFSNERAETAEARVAELEKALKERSCE